MINENETHVEVDQDWLDDSSLQSQAFRSIAFSHAVTKLCKEECATVSFGQNNNGE